MVVSSQVLAEDLTQFAAHQVGLEQRWRPLASRKARRGVQLPPKRGVLVETAADAGELEDADGTVEPGSLNRGFPPLCATG